MHLLKFKFKFAGGAYGGIKILSVVLVWNRAVINEFLFVCFVKLLLSLLFAQKSGFGWGIFSFFPAPVGTSGFPVSPTPSLGYMRQKENPNSTHHGSIWVTSTLNCLPSLHLSKPSYVCFNLKASAFSCVYQED